MPNPKLETYKNKATNTVYDLTDTDAQGKLTAILDGTTIDSFADVESALAGKEDTLTFDNAPTDGSSNPVKSDGVYDALQEKVSWDEQAVLGAYNIFPFPYLKDTQTSDGVTYTVDSQGVVDVNAASTEGYAEFQLTPYITDNRFKGMILSSGVAYSNNCYMRIREALADGTYVTEHIVNNELTIPEMTSGHKYYIAIRVGVTGVALDHLKFSPMISYKGGAFVLSAMTNRELTEKKVDKSAILLNASNDLNDIKNENQVGYYRWESAYPVNSPENKTWSIMQMMYYGGGVKQIVYYGSDNMYMRQYVSGTWSSWYKFTGTVVS